VIRSKGRVDGGSDRHGAINQAVKAIAISRGYVLRRPRLGLHPAFIDISIDARTHKESGCWWRAATSEAPGSARSFHIWDDRLPDEHRRL